MLRWLVIAIAAAIIAIVQWFLLSERIGHAFTLWFKLGELHHATDISRTSLFLFWSVSLPTLVASMYALDKLTIARSPLRWVAAFATVLVAAGCLVFFGMQRSEILGIR